MGFQLVLNSYLFTILCSKDNEICYPLKAYTYEEILIFIAFFSGNTAEGHIKIYCHVK